MMDSKTGAYGLVNGLKLSFFNLWSYFGNSDENNGTDVFHAIVMGIIGVLVHFANW